MDRFMESASLPKLIRVMHYFVVARLLNEFGVTRQQKLRMSLGTLLLKNWEDAGIWPRPNTHWLLPSHLR